ncbi:hypothetical protein K9N50_01985 [bacterium]|nr:hypothetical protein [bacterium]
MFHFKVFLSLLPGWMIVFAHYPFNLDVALSGLRTRGLLPEPVGIWVRIAGAFFLAYIWLPKSMTTISLIMRAGGVICIVISFIAGVGNKIR